MGLKTKDAALLTGSDTLETWRYAQRGVIGSMLVDARCCGTVFDRAREDFFESSACLNIFKAARSLWQNRQPVDPVTVLHALGSDAYADLLADIMLRTPSAANVEAYLDVCEEQSRMNAIHLCGMSLRVAETVDEAMQAYEQLGRTLRGLDRIEDVSLTDCISEYIDRMSDPTPPAYLTWGIPQLDALVDVSPGDFVILAAESSAGKTALALQFAYSQAAAGKRVGFFSLETRRQRLTDRLMAEPQVAGIELPRTKHKKLSPKDYERAASAGIRSDDQCLRLIRNAYTVEQIRMRTVMHGFEVIYIDYLQLIDMKGSGRTEIVTNISIARHRLAMELGVTVVALSQVSFPDKHTRKTINRYDLRESSQLLHDAEIIMILNVAAPDARTLTIDKFKDGDPAIMSLSFDARHMSFGYQRPPNAQKNITGQAELHDLDDGEEDENPYNR